MNSILWNGKMRVENTSTKNALSEEKSHVDHIYPERTDFCFVFGFMNLKLTDTVAVLLFG